MTDKIKDIVSEGNKLIAEFMGYKAVPKLYPNDKVIMRCEGLSPFYVDSSKYHTSWDWLMPVVEKIERIKGVHCVISELGCDIYLFGKRISDTRAETKLLTIWQAVVEFIKWYNSTKS